MKKTEDAIFKLVSQWSKKTEGKLKSALAARGKSHTNLYKKLKLKTSEKNGTIEVVAELTPSALFVEYGRRPGKQPPLNNIKDWCKSRGIPQSAAFPIARNIGRKGIKPTPFLKPLKDLSELLYKISKLGVQTVKEEIKNFQQELDKK